VLNTTGRTFPAPYSKTCDTFRPLRRECPARRAGLGGVAFVDDLELSPVSADLVREEGLEHAPRIVQHGFRHPCPGKPAGVHVADEYVPVPAGNPRAFHVRVMPPDVPDLCVDGPHAPPVSGVLRDGELLFPFAQGLRAFDNGSVGKRGKRLQAEIDADVRSFRSRFHVRRFDRKDDEPLARGFLHERPGQYPARQIAMHPEVQPPSRETEAAALDPDLPPLEGNPPKRAVGPALVADAEARTAFVRVTRRREPPDHFVISVGLDAELAPYVQQAVGELEPGRPEVDAGSVEGDTCVPDLIGSESHAAQPFALRSVLDTVFERQDHASMVNGETEHFNKEGAPSSHA